MKVVTLHYRKHCIDSACSPPKFFIELGKNTKFMKTLYTQSNLRKKRDFDNILIPDIKIRQRYGKKKSTIIKLKNRQIYQWAGIQYPEINA